MIFLYNSNMTIGVVIPTRGNRSKFLHQAICMLKNQTMQPQVIEIVNYPAIDNHSIDLVHRYHKGFEACFAKGCDVVFCWEDDDWYSSIYIEVMLNKWLLAGKPDLFGIGSTFYYHIASNRYLEIFHPKKSSMFCTMVTRAVMKLDFSKSNEYLDHFLWVKKGALLNAKTYRLARGEKPLALGIKHGIGKVAGGAHEPDSKYYTKHDEDKSFLKSVIGNDFTFYDKVVLGTEIDFNHDIRRIEPFLSIITRCYSRPIGFSRNQESIEDLIDLDIEQIFVRDNVGIGLYEANKALGFPRQIISGKYVFFLDDDDFITNSDMVGHLKRIAAEHNPDVIFFRMTIKNGQNNNYYPTDELCWGKKPIIARIGGSCFVVKRNIYLQFIHHFAKPRCGDFYFINEVFNSGAKVYWHDVKMCETGKVSRGKAE